ncbi:MAG: polysaccharide pyruvyl transferase family protein [Candidatus Moraniibacteriota bacterium]
MRAYWHQSRNFGDTLTPPIIHAILGEDVEFALRNSGGKLIAIGSIIVALRRGDVVWGTGSIRAGQPGCIKQPPRSKFLAVRGPLTRELIDGDVPEVYGDPGILLPIVYRPTVAITHKVGYMPHHVDREIFKKQHPIKEGELFIDIMQDWREVVKQILSCEEIVTSSLHGIVCSEAYGLPVTWVKYSDGIIGGEFKFQDYFLGTGRRRHSYGERIEPIQNLCQRQEALIMALKKHYGKN